MCSGETEKMKQAVISANLLVHLIPIQNDLYITMRMDFSIRSFVHSPH